MLSRLRKEESGAAAAEMALVAPLLMLIMFGSMELGHYFYSEHVVVKAVRDGARFASRQSMGQYSCGPDTISTAARDKIRWVTRTNTVDGTGTPRLGGWTSDATVDVSVFCVPNTSGTYVTMYEDGTNVPTVTVRATVPYSSLFKFIGFNSTGLQVDAREQAVVMGI